MLKPSTGAFVPAHAELCHVTHWYRPNRTFAMVSTEQLDSERVPQTKHAEPEAVA